MKIIPALFVVGIVLVGLGTVLIEDSPYDMNVVVEQDPFAPERPATLNHETAVDYLTEYEETRLQNDLLSTREYQLDAPDTVRADCTAISDNQTAKERFRVQLRCHGKIDDTKRLFEPPGFSYTVTYRLTETTQKQLHIHGYPYSTGDELRPPIERASPHESTARNTSTPSGEIESIKRNAGIHLSWTARKPRR